MMCRGPKAKIVIIVIGNAKKYALLAYSTSTRSYVARFKYTNNLIRITAERYEDTRIQIEMIIDDDHSLLS